VRWKFPSQLLFVVFSIYCAILLGGWIHGTNIPLNVWQSVKIGGAGAFFKLDIADQSDNEMVTGSDQYSCWLLTPGADTWQALNTTDRMAASVDANGVQLAPTCEEVVINKGRTTDLWMFNFFTSFSSASSFIGGVFKSTDRGQTITQVNFPSAYYKYQWYHGHSNKSRGPFIAPDPGDATGNRVYVSSYSGGVFLTTDGGTTFNAVPALGGGVTTGGAPSTVSAIGTDGTAIAVCTGDVAFTTTSGAFGFTVGSDLTVWETSNPFNLMYGTIKAYDPATHNFTLTVEANFGTCSHSDWSVGQQVNNNENLYNGGGTIFAYDPTSSVVGGVTQGIYACTYGAGVFHSTDGGGSWTQISGVNAGSVGPTFCGYMRVAPNSTLWFFRSYDGSGTSAVWKYVPGTTTWTNIAGGPTTSAAFDIDYSSCNPDASCKIITMESNGVRYSNNGGTNWFARIGLAALTGVAAADQPSWISTFINAGFGWFPGSAKFASNHDVYFGDEGTFYFTPTTNVVNPLILHTFVKGQENAEPFSMAADPTGSYKFFLGAFDFGNLYSTNVNSYTTIALSGFNPTLGALHNGHGVDFARAANQSYALTYTTVPIAPLQLAGIASSAGGTWGAIPNNPLGSSTTTGPCGVNVACPSGKVCASTKDDYILMPSFGSGLKAPYRTQDGGTTWTQITVTGAVVTGGWLANDFMVSCAADPSTVGHYWLYVWDIDGSGFDDRVVQCTNGGAAVCATTTVGALSLMTPGSANNGRIKSSSNGDPWYTPGVQGAEPKTTVWSYSLDGGATWPTVTGFKNVTAFGFGAKFPGKAYDSLYAFGWFTGTCIIGGVSQTCTSRPGTYMCKDFNTATGACTSTWQQIGTQYPVNIANDILELDGDKTSPGLVYGATTLAGAFWGQFN
jgi:hypothetical protein